MAFQFGGETNRVDLQQNNLTSVGAGLGDDVYVIDAANFPVGNKTITINDAVADGNNKLWLVGGLEIVSSNVYANAVELTLNNGIVVRVLGASTFVFQTGGKAFDTAENTTGKIETFQDFVTTSLKTTVPAEGEPASTGGSVTVQEAGGTDPTEPVEPVQTFSLTASNTNLVAEGNNVAFTVTPSAASAADVTLYVQISGASVGAITTQASADDFSAVLLPITIPAGSTAPVTVSATVNADTTTEGPEGFQAKLLDTNYAVVAGAGTITGTITEGVTSGQTYMLTKGLDNIQGTAGNDTIIGSIDAAGGNAELMTLSTLDIVNGGAGTDTLKIASSLAAATNLDLPNLTSVEIIEVEATKGVTINTSAVAGVTNLNITKQGAGKIDATAAATTDIAVTVKEDDAGVAAALANVIKGGKNVTVTATDLGGATGSTPDTITVGGAGALAAAGTVVVNATGAKSVAATDATLSAIKVTGGTSISVTQKATSDASAAAADTTGATITQGKVEAIANASTTTVTVKQDASVAEVLAATGKAVKAATQEVEFTDAKKGDTIELTFTTGNKLKFTAKKDLSAAEVASAFANLAVGDLQGKASAALGVYNDTGDGVKEWTSGAVQTVSATKAKVVFSNATDVTPTVGEGNVIVATATKVGAGSTFAATASAVTAGEGKVDAKTGVLGVANGQVLVDDAATAVIKTITIDGYGASSRIGTTADTTVLETLNLSNSGHTFNAAGKATATADIVVDDTAATLALNLEKVGTANEAVAGNGVAVVTLTAAPTTLNVKSTGNNYVNLTAALTETLNVSGTGLLDISTTDLAAVKTVKVTETAGLKLNAAVNDTVTSVDTTGTTGAVTVSINGDKATYAGGAGVDNVTVTNPGTIISKAIDLGAGNDKLDLSAATPVTPTVVLNGGTGDDTIVLKSADAASLSAGTAFAAKIDGFEKLEVTQALVNSTNEINLSNLDDIKYVITNGQVAGVNAQEVQDFTVTSGVTAKAVRATQTIDFTGVLVGATGAGNITVGGVTVALANSDNAAAIAGKVAAALNGTTAGTTQSVAAAAVGNVVTVTFDTRDGAFALLATGAGTAVLDVASTALPATTTAGTAYSANAQTITVGGVSVNLVAQDQTAAGVAVAGSGDDTAAEVATKIVAALDGNATYDAAGTSAAGAAVTVKWAANGDQAPISTAFGTSGVTIGAITETTAGKFATEQTLKNMLDGGTLEMLAAGSSTVVTMKDATALTDSFNIVTKAVNAANLGTVKVEGVETLNVTTVDTDATVTGVSSNTLTLSGNKAQTITVKGDGSLSLTLAAASTEVKLIDASTLKGALTVTTLAADTNATTVNGGDGADKLTAAGDNDVLNGGAGKDVLAVTGAAAFVKLTGGAGIDQFDLSGFKPSAGGSYASIRDLEVGETIKFVSNANANFNATKFVLGGAASFESYVSQAMGSATTANGGNTHGIAWFQFTSAGQVNTYVVQDVDGNSAFSANDIVVEIVGNKDLSNSSFNVTGEGTLLFL